METWYPTLEKPWLDVPFWVFITVQIGYYLICGVILYRILKLFSPGRRRNASLTLLLTMMVCAEIWNYLFLGLKSTTGGWIGMMLFTLIVIATYAHLRKADRYSSNLLIPYLSWLVIDNVWIFELWRVNR